MEITPDGLAGVIGPSIDGGVQGLEAHLEKQLIGVVAPEPVVLDVHETLADLEPLRQRFTGSGAPEHLLDNLVCRHAARRLRARSDRQRPPLRRARTARMSGLLSHVDGLTLPRKTTRSRAGWRA